eukprot:gene10205-11887_t
MKISVLILLCLCTLAVLGQQYSANWASLNSRPNPSWYDEAKFGIFIHWGVFSVPAYAVDGGCAEWYWETLETKSDGGSTAAYHNKSFGADFSYQEFAPQFTAHLFDPKSWVQTIQSSGAKYVVLTSKHHEGFTMWDSPQSWSWNAKDTGPKMDVVGALSSAVKSAGIHMGLYFSQYEWFNPLYLSDKASGSPPTSQEYVNTVSYPQMIDIVTKYEPDVIWSDGEWEQTSSYWRTPQFLSWLYSNSTVKDSVVVNDRWGSECRGVNGGFYTGGDKWNPGHLIPHKWENCNTIGSSWGNNQAQPLSDYQTSTQLIQELVSTVACGGNLLLNVGPTAQGVIPIVQQERLSDIGQWLGVNGESIYNTNPWRVQNDTESGNQWYTTNSHSGAVYATIFEWPEDNVVTLTSPVTSKQTVITLLGVEGNLSYNSNGAGVNIKLPFLAPAMYPPHQVYVLKLMGVK